MCGSFETKEVQIEKWLGQMFSAQGLADSVAKTVTARTSKIKAACLEIAQIVNDWRSQAVGGMATALVLWEACCLPSLLHGAGTWTEINTKTVKQLNSLQYWFLRLALQVGPGSPKPSLLWDMGVLDMGLRVWIEKAMLVLHVRKLEEGSLARRVYEEQVTKEWPGLAQEVDQICRELGVESALTTKMSKKVYRSKLISACHTKNEERIKYESEGKVKCERILAEEYGRKDYVDSELVSHVRDTYRARFGLMPFAGNFKKDKRFSGSGDICRCKRNEESEPYLLLGECEV